MRRASKRLCPASLTASRLDFLGCLSRNKDHTLALWKSSPSVTRMRELQAGASLDLRPTSAFARSHLAQATHIDGLEALSHRFSTLPAPAAVDGVRICVVVVARKDWDAAREALERWNFAAWVVGEDEVDASSELESDSSEMASKTLAKICSSLPPAEAGQSDEAALKFWRSARKAGLVFSSTNGERAAEDRPRLLHSPSPLVPRAMSMWQCVEPGKTIARALDLGCGGGRDLAWICELGRLAVSASLPFTFHSSTLKS